MLHYLGVDIGGTNIKIGIVSEEGKPVANASFSTKADDGPKVVAQCIGQQVDALVAKAGMKMDQLAGAGIGCPGPLDQEAGVVIAAPNLIGWDNAPMRDLISKATGLPAIFENDANAAAYGEFWAGAGRDPAIRHVIMLTLGTGVGGGIVVDGQLVRGKFGNGAELGHVIVQPEGRLCGCGQRGCIETYASASNVARIAKERLEAGEASSLKAVLESTGRVSSKAVFEHAAQGDAFAMALIDQTTNYLGIMCVNICRIFDPQMIVFAGGMTLAGDMLFSKIREAFERHTWHLVKERVKIVPAELGNDAGFIGAAAVAWDGKRRGALVLAR